MVASFSLGHRNICQSIYFVSLSVPNVFWCLTEGKNYFLNWHFGTGKAWLLGAYFVNRGRKHRIIMKKYIKVVKANMCFVLVIIKTCGEAEYLLGKKIFSRQENY